MISSRPAKTTLPLFGLLEDEPPDESTDDLLFGVPKEELLKIPLLDGAGEVPGDDEQVDENPDREEIYENVVVKSESVDLDEKLESSTRLAGFLNIPTGTTP